MSSSLGSRVATELASGFVKAFGDVARDLTADQLEKILGIISREMSRRVKNRRESRRNRRSSQRRRKTPRRTRSSRRKSSKRKR